MYKFVYTDDCDSIIAHNPSDNIIEIEISHYGNRKLIQLDMDDKIQMNALRNLAGFIQSKINEWNNKRLEKLGYEKPSPDAVTVGDLIGLKREE